METPPPKPEPSPAPQAGPGGCLALFQIGLWAGTVLFLLGLLFAALQPDPPKAPAGPAPVTRVAQDRVHIEYSDGSVEYLDVDGRAIAIRRPGQGPHVYEYPRHR